MAFRPPEYAALINPIAVNAFAMRIEVGGDLSGGGFLSCLCKIEIGPREWSPRDGICSCKKPHVKKGAHVPPA